jgi:hypothetical protein
MKAFLPMGLCLVTAGLSAQTNLFVLPKGSDKLVTTNNDQSYLGRGGKNYNGSTTYVPIHVQNGYATADLPQAAMKLSGIAYRRNNYYGNNMYASTSEMVIHMSTTASAPSGYSTTFASNEGTNRTLVFGTTAKPGVVKWPAMSKGTGPAPFIFKIPLDKPFVLVQSTGKGFTIDTYITKRDSTYTSGSNTYNANLFLDAAGNVTGTRTTNGVTPSKCPFSTGKYNSSLSYTTGGLSTTGGPWYVSYGNLPLNTLGVGAISAFGVDNNKLLPIDLGPLGATGCQWNVGLEIGFFPLTTTNSTTTASARWPTLTIPPLPAGSFFYDQGLFVDTKANKLGLVTSWSSKWTIAQQYSPDVVTVYKTTDTTPPATTGFKRSVFGAVTELQY